MSRISRNACPIEAAENLISEFGAVLSEIALFLTHIHTLEIGILHEGETEATPIQQLQVTTSNPIQVDTS